MVKSDTRTIEGTFDEYKELIEDRVLLQLFPAAVKVIDFYRRIMLSTKYRQQFDIEASGRTLDLIIDYDFNCEILEIIVSYKDSGTYQVYEVPDLKERAYHNLEMEALLFGALCHEIHKYLNKEE